MDGGDGSNDLDEQLELLETACENLDRTQERVEEVSELFLSSQDPATLIEYVEIWSKSLEDADPSNRMPFLYVLNQILFKRGDEFAVNREAFTELEGGQVLQWAISNICKFPGDRENVVGILKLWQEKNILSSAYCRELWKFTGEAPEDNVVDDLNTLRRKNLSRESVTSLGRMDLDHLANIVPDEFGGRNGNNSGRNSSGRHSVMSGKNELGELGDAFDPLVTRLRFMDVHRAKIKHLESTVRNNSEIQHLMQITQMMHTPEEMMAVLDNNECFSIQDLKTKVDKSLFGLRLLRKSYDQWGVIEKDLKNSIGTAMKTQHEVQIQTDEMLGNLDQIEMALHDLINFKKRHAREWALRAQLWRIQQRREEEKHAKMNEAMRLKHKEFVTKTKEAEKEESDRLKARAAAEEEERRELELQKKEKNEQTMIWNPATKELMPAPASYKNDHDSWRDH